MKASVKKTLEVMNIVSKVQKRYVLVIHDFKNEQVKARMRTKPNSRLF